MISVFVPSHITGFFSILDNENPLIKGSLGAGVLLDKGVVTEISKSSRENENHSNHPSILINGKVDDYNQNIILATIGLMKKDFDFDLSDVEINLTIQVPIGCGLGTSAASAIGCSICINEFFELGLSMDECGQYAHLAELELGTGLGDVIGEMSRGIVLRTKPGAPGYGEVRSLVPHEKTGIGEFIEDDNEFYVLVKTLGEISTASVIQDSKYHKIITDVGLAMNREFTKTDDGVLIGSKFKNKFNVAVGDKFNDEEEIRKFMKCSYQFAKRTGLINDELISIIHSLNGKVLGASMAMLGNTVFAILTEKQKFKLEAEHYGEFDFYKMETEGIRIKKD